MTSNQPGPVRPDSLRIRSETQDGGLEVGVAIDAESHGSRLVFGVEWIRPGTERVSWEIDAETYETYYVQSGSLEITWSGPDSGTSALEAGECFYFPPGRAYTIENVGEDDVFLVWAITPALPGG